MQAAEPADRAVAPPEARALTRMQRRMQLRNEAERGGVSGHVDQRLDVSLDVVEVDRPGPRPPLFGERWTCSETRDHRDLVQPSIRGHECPADLEQPNARLLPSL